MCDLPILDGSLATAVAMLIAATVSIGIAAGLNGGFFTAPGAPVPMGFAAGFSFAALGALITARVMVQNYFNCVGAPEACLGDFSNVENVLNGLITVVGIQAVACTVTAAVAWIPGGAQPAMWAIFGTLVIQVALIPSIAVFYNDLRRCIEENTYRPVISPLVTTYLVAVYSSIWGLGMVYLRKRNVKNKN